MSDVEKSRFRQLLNYREIIKDSPLTLKKYYNIALKHLDFELEPHPKNVYMFCNDVFLKDSLKLPIQMHTVDFLFVGPMIEQMYYGNKHREYISATGYAGSKKVLDIMGPFVAFLFENYLKLEGEHFSWYVGSKDLLGYTHWNIPYIPSFIDMKLQEKKEEK